MYRQHVAAFSILCLSYNQIQDFFRKGDHLSLIHICIFYICEYLEITPKDFFDIETNDPTKANELYNIAKQLDSDHLDHLIALAKGLQK